MKAVSLNNLTTVVIVFKDLHAFAFIFGIMIYISFLLDD